MSYRAHPTRSGWYYVENRLDGWKGKIDRRVIKGIDKAIALDNAIKANKLKPVPEQEPRFKDVVDQYLIWVKREQSDKTLHNKATRFERYIMPYFGELRIKDLTQALLDGYATLHTRMIYRVDMAHLMALIKWMQKRKLGPLLTFKPESVPVHPQVKTIPASDDILKVLELIPSEKGKIVFTLILFTGLRWSEATMLRWENVDLKSGMMRIAEVADAQTDVVPIPGMIMQWLKDNQQLSGWVFPGRKKGTHITRLDRSLNKACDVVGIKLNPHLLRHASATLLYQATGDIYAVQHHLRHSKVATSQIYTRFSVDQKRKSMDRLIEQVFNKKKPAKPTAKRVKV
jgi:integrase